ncbi:MAG: 4Fe-4S binding protein [Thermoanaerobacterales bacterium]|nr:4Fe-4S binding protein [Thermoanaerobacterales bacterium]
MDTVCRVTESEERLLAFASGRTCGSGKHVRSWCIPCTVALKQAAAAIGRIRSGHAGASDEVCLRECCRRLPSVIRCKFGRTAWTELGRLLEGHGDPLEEHVTKKQCAAGVCPGLVSHRIDPERCVMCDQCREACPEKAIVGRRYVAYRTDNQPYRIVTHRCTNCEQCIPACPENAIVTVSGEHGGEVPVWS